MRKGALVLLVLALAITACQTKTVEVEVPVEVEKVVTKEVPVEKVVTEEETTVTLGVRRTWGAGFSNFCNAMHNLEMAAMDHAYMLLKICNSENETQPYLAESITFPDAQTMIIKIRDEAVWSDGVPVTSADVLWTYNTLANPKVTSYGRAGILGMQDVKDGKANTIAGVTALDDKTVQVVWEEGQTHGESPWIGGDDNIFPAHVLSKIPLEQLTQCDYPEAQKPTVTCGPYAITQVVRDQFVLTEKVEGWWGNDIFGEPQIDNVIYVSVTDGEARLKALLAGDIDVTMRMCTPQEVEQLTAQYPDIDFMVRPTLGMFGVQFNMQAGIPQKVRYAMDYAADREALLQVFSGGYGTVEYDWVSNSPPYETDDYVKREYDFDYARELLSESVSAGEWDITRVVRFVASATLPQGYKDMLSLYQAELEAVGFQCSMQFLDGEVSNETILAGDYEITVFGGGAARGDPLGACGYFTVPPEENGYWYQRIGWYDQAYSDACKKALAVLDEDERRPYIQEAIRIYNETPGPWQMFGSTVEVWGANKRLGGVVPSGGHPYLHWGNPWYGLLSWYIVD